jgi:hypothetical protein
MYHNKENPLPYTTESCLNPNFISCPRSKTIIIPPNAVMPYQVSKKEETIVIPPKVVMLYQVSKK